MSKKLLLILSVVALVSVSCESLSLSKKEALYHIGLQNGELGVKELSVKIPQGLITHNDLTRRYSSFENAMEVLGMYESAGLIVAKDSTYSYRQWRSVKNVEAIDIHLTPLGRESLIAETDKEVTVKSYSYVYKKIVDIKPLYNKSIEELSCNSVAQVVYFSGSVVEASPFAELMNVNVGDYYPICEDKDEVQAALVWGFYRTTALWGLPLSSDLIDASLETISTIKKSEIDEHYNRIWVNMAKGLN